MYVQIMPEKDAYTYHLNPFDLTKVWPKGDYPLIEVGTLELNRNPENFFAEVDQAAFTPANVPLGSIRQNINAAIQNLLLYDLASEQVMKGPQEHGRAT